MLAPSLLAIPGCGALTAAKIIGETAQVGRFHSKDAFARHNAGRAVTSVVVESCATSSLAHREPANQCRYSPDRSDSSTVPRTRPRVARPTPKER
ncbi:transposase [Rhodococcus sp. KBS0724]|uniref:transposase n=1 Tax=Rhodococcus sp. KBS0724 TaxID=1179674 RepID=UPI0037C76464